jgi:hypothetical protein
MTYRDREIIALWTFGVKTPDIAARLRMTEVEVEKVVAANAKPDVTIKVEKPV